jgi:hypothetical protein
MSNLTVPSMNLQAAVLMQVQEFTTANRPFSRYEITQSLREKCNNGQLEIPELENTNPGATYRFDIRKSAVDDIFDELFNNCSANGLPPLRVDFDRTKGYRLFSVDTAPSTPAGGSVIPASSYTPFNPTPVAVPAPAPANAAFVKAVSKAVATNVQILTSPLPVPAPTIALTDNEVRRRVTQYMQRCVKLGKTPTLKNVQSAIKRGNKSTGLSYREIVNITKSLGFKVANPV